MNLNEFIEDLNLTCCFLSEYDIETSLSISLSGSIHRGAALSQFAHDMR